MLSKYCAGFCVSQTFLQTKKSIFRSEEFIFINQTGGSSYLKWGYIHQFGSFLANHQLNSSDVLIYMSFTCKRSPAAVLDSSWPVSTPQMPARNLQVRLGYKNLPAVFAHYLCHIYFLRNTTVNFPKGEIVPKHSLWHIKMDSIPAQEGSSTNAMVAKHKISETYNGFWLF